LLFHLHFRLTTDFFLARSQDIAAIDKLTVGRRRQYASAIIAGRSNIKGAH
jgi:hypothetical protein